MNSIIIARYLLDCLFDLQSNLKSVIGDHIKYNYDDLADFYDEVIKVYRSYGGEK